ncbi:uncharacterized protein LOC142225820 [Haematobia irritans]|uniref:uncharacterized protein LOC142225820 n=1 Tax=Haematobia irritans TaxID=7368 RepID=UPI003F509F0D
MELRSNSRNAAMASNTTSTVTATTNTTTTTNTATNTNTTTTTTTLTTSTTTPAIAEQPDMTLGPRTHSSLGDDTISSPDYSSITAIGIRNEFQARRANEESNGPPRNDDNISIRDYITASVGANQARTMREINEDLRRIIPEIVRETIRSERALSSTGEVNPDPIQPSNSNRTRNSTANTPGLNFSTAQEQPITNSVGHRQNYRADRNAPQRQRRNFPRQPVGNQFPTTNGQDNDFYHNGRFYQQPQQNFAAATAFNVAPPSHLDLEKWGIHFDATNKSVSVEDFIFRVETLREDTNYPWPSLLKGFHRLLSGSAYEWFWNFRRQNPNCTWDDLKCNLKRKFQRFESDFEIQRRIMERRQHYGESADTFLNEIVSLNNQMRVSIPENELVKMVKDNLKDGLSQLIFPMYIMDMNHLLDECRRAERNLSKRNLSRQMNPQQHRRVNELEYSTDYFYDAPQPQQREGMTQDFQLEALKMNSPPNKPIVCWNCKRPGHTFIDCDSNERSLFCYRCGFENVISPNCPRCTGNNTKSMMRTGPSCSSVKQPQ